MKSTKYIIVNTKFIVFLEYYEKISNNILNAL